MNLKGFNLLMIYTRFTAFSVASALVFSMTGGIAYAQNPVEDRVGFIAQIQNRFLKAAEHFRLVLAERQQDFRADRIVIKKRGEASFRVIPVETGEDVTSAIQKVMDDEEIEYAEPDYTAHALLVPNDPYWMFQWNLQKNGGGINAEEAWGITAGTGVIAAVIDTGVAYENDIPFVQAPDLAGTLFAAGYDFVNNDEHPNDDNGHGTHVAGTIAQATGNGIGVAGVAYGATIMPLKVLDQSGSGSYSNVANAIRWAADNGAQVINLSLGGSSPATYLEDALAYAHEKGVVIVAAAGNDGTGYLSYPAAYDQYVVAVGATRFDKTKASYSNYGYGLDVMAPGGDTSIDQNGDGYGDGILQQTFSGAYSNFSYYFYQGTSMATPHVAGIAALVIANGKATTTSAVRKAIENSAEDLGPAGYDTTYGFGLVNAYRAVQYEPTASPLPVVNLPPIADAGPNISGTTFRAVTLDGSASLDSDGSIVSYKWAFGDGKIGSGKIVTHRYTRAGTYTAKLTVTDNNGATATDTTIVTIKRR